MRKTAFVLTGLAVCVLAAPALAAGDCTCKTIKKTGAGWCDDCKSGAMFGVKIKSAKLYKALQGKKIDDIESIKCPACKTAAGKDGSCDHCRVSFHDGAAYHSPVAHTLAQGHGVKVDEMKCAGCKSAATKGGGFCKGCDAGIVGTLAFHGAKLFKQAKQAMKTLETAAKAAQKCESCAVGMVSDGKCEACKVEFKNGQPQKKA